MAEGPYFIVEFPDWGYTEPTESGQNVKKRCVAITTSSYIHKQKSTHNGYTTLFPNSPFDNIDLRAFHEHVNLQGRPFPIGAYIDAK